jgi:hypothetical protein
MLTTRNVPRARAARASLGHAVIVGVVAGLAVMAGATPAWAGNPACSALTNPIYVTGSDKITTALLGQALALSQINVVYRTEASCLAVNAIINGTTIVTTPTDLSASHWDMTGAEQLCDLPAAGQIPDVGISDIFPSTCPNPLPNGLPSNVRDFLGPVEAYTFVVPKMSSQLSISKEAAYFVYGFGSGSGVAPWTDMTEIFQRDPSSGTQQMFSIAFGVPATMFQATATTSSADMVAHVSMATNPDAAIGLLTGEVTASASAQVSILAYQDADQTCGYWPDSTSTATDKRNVRDGHYAIWGPLHFLTTVDAQGYPSNANAKDFIAYLTGTMDPPNGFDLISLLAKAGIVPQCAMQVQRSSELGPLASFQPERSCGCDFDKVSSGSTTCTPCTSDSECPATAPRCNYKFCEAQ